jgi:hypothetical protein
MEKKNLAEKAFERFVWACQEKDPQFACFSRKGKFAIGRWGYNSTIFSLETGDLYRPLLMGEEKAIVIYRIPFIGYPMGGPDIDKSIDEVLFGSSWESVAFGVPDKPEEHRLSDQEAEVLFSQLREERIEPTAFIRP